jgi:hypothetical protein
MIEKQKTYKFDHLLSIIWLIFLTFPNNTLFFMFVPMAYIILFRFQTEVKLNVGLDVLLFLYLLFLSYLINIGEPWVDFKSQIKVVVFAIMFISFGRLRGNKILKPYIYVALAYLIISQFAFIINFSPLTSFYSNFYYSEAYDVNMSERFGHITSTLGLGTDYRLGGIFFNSNQFARYVEMIMVVLLCEVKQFSKKSLMIVFPFIVLSVIATGSRTSMMVLILSILYYFYSAKIFSKQKLAVIILVSAVVLYMVYRAASYDGLRVFALNEGMNDSLGVKWKLVTAYLNVDIPILKLLFGNLSGRALGVYINSDAMGTDWEIGNLILVYGFTFLVLVLIFYFILFKRYLPKYRVIFITLLWMFSSSILLNYRTAAVWMLILGLYYRRSLEEKTLKMDAQN